MSGSAFRMVPLSTGLALACRTVGDGPIPVIFIHGYSMSSESWDRAVETLPRRYTGYAYDLRGFGKSGRAQSYSLADHVADLFALMDALALEGAALVGHSLGATIAQLAALKKPQCATAMVLSNGRAGNLPPPDPIAGMVEERVRAYGSAEDNRKVLQGRMADYFHPANVAPGDISRFVELGTCADTMALQQTLRSIYTCPAVEPGLFARISAPVLVMSGEFDHVTPMDVAHPLAQVLPAAEFAVVPGAGHTSMWERPGEWRDRAYGFLNRVL